MPVPPYNASREKRFIVTKGIGKPDSLKRPVRIAFTITPHKPDGPSHPYSPLATYVTPFNPHGVERVELKWYPRSHPHSAVVDGKNVQVSAPYGAAEAGYAVTLPAMSSQWGEAVPLTSGLTPQGPSCLIKNESGSNTDIVLHTYAYLIAYHHLKNGHSIIVPSSWEIQAYIVDNDIIDKTILQEEDLKSPIFATPVLWDALPAGSTWVLVQDNDGTVRLNNDEFNPVKPVTNPPVQQEVEPVVKKDPLSELFERFALMEQSIARIQDDVAAGQKTMDGIQKQLSALERGTKEEGQPMHTEFKRSIAVVEANAATLTSSFNQNRDQLSEMRKSVTGTQQLLSGLEKSTHNRISTLEEAATRTQNYMVVVEKAVHQTQDTVSIVQQLVLGKQPSRIPVASGPVSPLRAQPIGEDDGIRAVEARVEKLERVVQEQRKVIRAVDRRLPDMDARADKLEVDLGAVQVLVTGLGRRVSTMEARSKDEDGGTEGSASSSNLGSPVMFPTHLVDGPRAT